MIIQRRSNRHLSFFKVIQDDPADFSIEWFNITPATQQAITLLVFFIIELINGSQGGPKQTKIE